MDFLVECTKECLENITYGQATPRLRSRVGPNRRAQVPVFCFVRCFIEA